jgi:uncharacterized protein (DUF58 family)
MLEAILNSIPLFTVFTVSLLALLVYSLLTLGVTMMVAIEERALEEGGNTRALANLRREKKNAQYIFSLALMKPK